MTYPKTFAEAIVNKLSSEKDNHAAAQHMRIAFKQYIRDIVENPKNKMQIMRQLGIEATREKLTARGYSQGSGPGESFDAVLYTVKCAGWTSWKLYKGDGFKPLSCSWGMGYQVERDGDWNTVISNYDSSG